MIRLPKRFSLSTSILLCMFSFLTASLFDNSIGATHFDLYDILDGPKYTIMDLIAYFLYLPFGYLFYYFYDKYQISGYKTVGYIILWTIFSIVFEWVCVQFNVFTYKNGYHLIYSATIYLFVLTLYIPFTNYITKKQNYST